MASGYWRMALEQVPNAEGGANKVSTVVFDLPVTEAGFQPEPTLLDLADEIRGYPGYPQHQGAAEYALAGNFKVNLRPGSMAMLLALAAGGVTTTPGVGGAGCLDPDSVQIPVGGYRHVASWAVGDTPQTCEVNYSPPAGLFYKATGVGIQSIDFGIENGVWKTTCDLAALYWSIIADPVITPAPESVSPFIHGDMVLTWLGGTAVTKDFSFKIENKLVTDRQFTVRSKFPDRIRIDSPFQELTGSIPKEAMDATDWDALVNGTPFSAKIKLEHSTDFCPVGSPTYPYQMWIEMPACQYVKGSIDAIKNDRRHEASFDWAARYDTGTSKWATITVVNQIPAISTYP
jgi:hypothetical protein